MQKIDSFILEVLENYSIDIPSIKEIKPLMSGINRVYLVNVGRSKYVLKEYIKLKDPELSNTHSILVELMKKGINIPTILPNKEGNYLTRKDTRSFDLSLFIDHVDHSDQINISDKHLKLVAEELADIHKVLDKNEVILKLEKMDFNKKAEDTIENIKIFLLEFDNILKSANEKERFKLNILKKIIELTNKYRTNNLNEFAGFLSQDFKATHGDFSMLNTLVTADNKVFVIDWDNLKLRPLIWDLQAGISLFSSSIQGNAYVVKPDLKRVEIFLKSYLNINPLSADELKLLPEVIKYNFSIYWLSYTVPAMLNKDFRLLYLIPYDTEDALYWTENFDEYKNFIKNFTKTLT